MHHVIHVAGSVRPLRGREPCLMSSLGETRHVCRIQLPSLARFVKTSGHAFGIYVAGAVFAAGWWLFFDACIRSGSRHPPVAPPAPGQPIEPPVHDVRILFDDWVPGICATIGLAIVNLVDKRHLVDDGSALGTWRDDPVMWRTRTWLFVGFAFLAGGLAGSLALLIIKYMMNPHAVGYVEYGVASVLQNLAIMACAIVLWFIQRTESDYEYSLTL